MGKRFRSNLIAFLILSFLALALYPSDAEAGKKKNKKKKKQIAGVLTANDVKLIIAQAAAQAETSGVKATIALVDKEGNFIGAFQMTGAEKNLRILRPGPLCFGGDDQPPCEPLPVNLEKVPFSGTVLAALSKAGTGSFLSTQGMAFSSRTASFIVQQHFPPGVTFTASGPLFGVQFSQLLCSDVITTVSAGLPLGLSADPGGIPLYKDGLLAGGIGIEVDGDYDLDEDPRDLDQPVEELIAVSASRGFEPPPDIRGENIIVNGLRFPFVDTPMPAPPPVRPFDQLSGTPEIEPRDGMPSSYENIELDGVQVKVQPEFREFKDGQALDGSIGLTAADVQRILVQGVKQANITRAAIRQPLGSAAEVNLTVVDVNGTVLGIVSTPDAPQFGFDVSAQKARTAAFFSKPTAAAELRAAESGKFTPYVEAAHRDGIRLDGSVAFSDRAVGFLSRPFFPDDIDDTENGPFSVPIEQFSPFNTGLQIDLLFTTLADILTKFEIVIGECTKVPGLGNGIQIFAGSVPLYKNGQLVGAIGVSGDGIDQDDIISTMGSAGFEAPAAIRSDRVFVRDVRLPYVKFPRHPNL